MEQVSESKSFGGKQLRYSHSSESLKCDMHFSIYLPPQAEVEGVPIIYWLSGLTCTDENFVYKAGAQKYAAEHGVAIVAPDTSPRGDDVPDDPESYWDFGLGAGFYVDATQAPWDQHYKMYSYLSCELPALIAKSFRVDHTRVSIMGHSMGGHGALIIALKRPNVYRSVSAFSPICSPLNCPWGDKALGNYLGSDVEQHKQYDTSELIKASPESKRLPILVDQGGNDEFLETQLKPEILRQTCSGVDYPLNLRIQPGYDHSYYFIASFIGEHIAYHAKALKI